MRIEVAEGLMLEGVERESLPCITSSTLRTAHEPTQLDFRWKARPTFDDNRPMAARSDLAG